MPGILERAGQTSIQNKLALFEEQLASIRSTTTEEEKDVESIGSILLDLYTQLEQLDNGNSEIAAIPTGFYDLDTILGGGLHRQELVILAGRPSMGKSAAAHQIAYSIAKQQNFPTLLFSLEMSKKQVVGRIAAAESAIPANCFRTGQMGTAQWQTLAMQMLDMELVPFYISDYFSNSVLSIGAKIKQAIAQYGQISLVVVDYLQLMSGGENEVRELGEITRRFKILARECNVPIILLSQLSRGVESRTDKRPMMSDLRSSGAIEQDADVVIMLYRDEYYNQDSPDRGIAEMIVVKQRNGPTGTVKLLFDAQYTKFKNLIKRE
ncbi:replicative DNA helicase [Nostoc sp. UHCC 0302]|uniref:replicative DNA helicase n=1 Tax=Nostoc sp. UHCC 0302 TaxID=3134896 RepID=UPI00311CBA9F